MIHKRKGEHKKWFSCNRLNMFFISLHEMDGRVGSGGGGLPSNKILCFRLT